MTAIAGFTDGNTVWIGGDSAGVGGMSLTVRADQKVFTVGELLIGFTTSFRMGQLLRYGWAPPALNEGQGIDDFMVTSFIDSVRARFKAGGFAEKKDDAEIGGSFLVGFRGRLFHIESDYQVGEPAASYDACGCGDDICNGAFYALEGYLIHPDHRVLTALRAAETHSAGVRGPFVVKSITKTKQG